MKRRGVYLFIVFFMVGTSCANAGTIKRITNNSYPDDIAQINNLGHLAWNRITSMDDQGNMSQEIILYDGSTEHQLTNDGNINYVYNILCDDDSFIYMKESPDFSQYLGLYYYNGTAGTHQLIGDYSGSNNTMNNSKNAVWAPYGIEFYNGNLGGSPVTLFDDEETGYGMICANNDVVYIAYDSGGSIKIYYSASQDRETIYDPQEDFWMPWVPYLENADSVIYYYQENNTLYFKRYNVLTATLEELDAIIGVSSIFDLFISQSPNGRYIAYDKGDDIFVLDTSTKTTEQITTDGIDFDDFFPQINNSGQVVWIRDMTLEMGGTDSMSNWEVFTTENTPAVPEPASILLLIAAISAFFARKKFIE